MATDETLQRIDKPFDELATVTLMLPLSVPDGTGGSRPPLLSELTALEFSVYLLDGAYITVHVFSAGTWAPGSEVLQNVDVKNTGRGAYNEALGQLVITLHAGDMPCQAANTEPGLVETHEAIMTGRYNANLDQLHARVQFKVRNLNKVPRVP